MSVKNVTVLDLGLIEILDGNPNAPVGVLTQLAAQGYLEFAAGGRPVLTERGRQRARKLKPAAHDLRLAFAGAATGGGCRLTSIGSSAFVG